NTPQLLAELQQEYQQLNVFRRSPQASGGKSGALNQVLPLIKGDIIAVFDADAQVTPDLLFQVVPLFEKDRVGAVQIRKAIANAPENFWTKGQMAEMLLDIWFQEQRTAIGGIGELRGNGQFVRR
ncbi:MAG: glycosyltransferase family 2 protein, partial [Dolichospermum sp.]